MKIIRYTVMIILFILINYVHTQTQEYQFEHISTGEGLATYWMAGAAMEQDAQGFLWFGSDDGLHKYDGYRFTVFSNDESDSTTISNNRILSIFNDSQGRLWIGTPSGLNKWLPENETFERINFDLNKREKTNTNLYFEIAEDVEGNLWISGHGLTKFNPETKVFKTYLPDSSKNNSISSDYLLSICIDKNNTMWISSDNGLNRYNQKTDDFTKFDLPQTDNNLNKLISVIFEDLANRLLMGGGSGGSLFYFDKEKEEFEYLNNDKNNPISIYALKNSSGREIGTIPGVVIDIIQPVSTKEYWIATNSVGINRFDSLGKLINVYDNTYGEKTGFKNNDIMNLFEDKSNTLWFGTGNDGIYKSVSAANNFLPSGYGMPELDNLSNKHIISVLEDSKNNLWLGTIDGYLFKYNIKSKKLSEYNSKSNSQMGFGQGDINFIKEDSLDRIWIGTRYGLSLYKPSSDNFDNYFVDQNQDDKNNFVLFEENKPGELFVGRWEWRNSSIINYRFNPDAVSPEMMFIPDQKNIDDLYLKKENGEMLKVSIDTLRKYLPKVSRLISIVFDRNELIWFSTSTGLVVYNHLTNWYKLFNADNGLLVNTFGNIFEDDDGNIWAGNSAGVLKISPDLENTIQMGESDGLNNNLYQPQNASFKSKSGLLYFGGSNGLTVIDPKRFNANKATPFVQITDLQIFGKSIPITEKGILNKSITMSKNVELDYDQNDITIEYVGLHYKNPKKNKYAYKLEPYETEWNMVGENRTARYTNLSANDYTFTVKAANSDGIWNKEGKSLTITINPPWWKTTTAYIGYGLAILLGIFGVDRFQRKRLLAKAKERMKIQGAEHRAEAAELQAKAAEAQSRVIQAENERKTKELEEARQLQLSMLPKELPKLNNLEIAVYMKTATEVGGDYYDFSIKDDGSLNVCLGDATGHGMKAGTLVSMMKSLFTANSVDKDLVGFFTTSNNALKNSKLDKMMMAFAMLNINKNLIQFANAGIPPLFIFRNTDGIVEEVKLNGLPLGAMNNTKYNIYENELSIGDTILMLSDGMPELQNQKNEMYGYERLIQLFAAIGNLPSINIVEKLKEEGLDWAIDSEPDDDITFVVIKVK